MPTICLIVLFSLRNYIICASSVRSFFSLLFFSSLMPAHALLSPVSLLLLPSPGSCRLDLPLFLCLSSSLPLVLARVLSVPYCTHSRTPLSLCFSLSLYLSLSRARALSLSFSLFLNFGFAPSLSLSLSFSLSFSFPLSLSLSLSAHRYHKP